MTGVVKLFMKNSNWQNMKRWSTKDKDSGAGIQSVKVIRNIEIPPTELLMREVNMGTLTTGFLLKTTNDFTYETKRFHFCLYANVLAIEKKSRGTVIV